MVDGRLYVHFRNLLGYWVRCAGHRCGEASPLADNPVEAVSKARSAGWVINEYRALCPEHRNA